MDALTIINTVAAVIQQAVAIGPSVIKGVEDAVPFAEAIVANITGKKTVTQADLDALTAQIATLSAQLQAALPAAQPGDPDFTG
jgi:hypothetical protein